MAQPMVDVGRPVSPKQYSLAATSAGDGTYSGTITLNEVGWVYQVELVPGAGGDAPSAFTTFTVKNANGTDLLNGAGAGASVSANTMFCIDPPIFVGATTITVAASGMGDSNKATVYLWAA